MTIWPSRAHPVSRPSWTALTRTGRRVGEDIRPATRPRAVLGFAPAVAGWTHRCSCSSVRRLAVDVPGESGGVLDEEFA